MWDVKTQIYWTKSTEQNIPNKIHSIKPTKLKSPNQFYQTKSSLTSFINFMQQILNEVKQSSSSSLSWAWPSTVPACLVFSNNEQSMASLPLCKCPPPKWKKSFCHFVCQFFKVPFNVIIAEFVLPHCLHVTNPPLSECPSWW